MQHAVEHRVRFLPADARSSIVLQLAGAPLGFLSPYSLDLNPIENAFSELRQLYESAGHRTIDTLWSNTQRLVDAITPRRCKRILQTRRVQDCYVDARGRLTFRRRVHRRDVSTLDHG